MKQRDWKRKRDVIRHYNGLANVYDSLYSGEQNLKIKSALDTVQIRGSDLILDVGCGTGLLLDNIGDPVRLIVGLDLSRRLLKVATNRSKRLSESLFISLICADADYMPFPNEVFDKVFAVTLLHDMPDLNSALREIMRVAKGDATIVLTGLKRSFSEERFAIILSDAGLNFSIIKTDEQVRCYVAICHKGER